MFKFRFRGGGIAVLKHMCECHYESQKIGKKLELKDFYRQLSISKAKQHPFTIFPVRFFNVHKRLMRGKNVATWDKSNMISSRIDRAKRRIDMEGDRIITSRRGRVVISRLTSPCMPRRQQWSEPSQQAAVTAEPSTVTAAAVARLCRTSCGTCRSAALWPTLCFLIAPPHCRGSVNGR